MRGEISSAAPSKRHPLDWYVDEIWCARQLAAALGGFRKERERELAVWDPCCGMGNTLVAAWEQGLRCWGSDLVDNFDWRSFETEDDSRWEPHWFSADFLDRQTVPARCSIVFNPPYSYIPGIAEVFIRKALTMAEGRVCALMPVKWLAPGKDVKAWSKRSRLFRKDHPPQAVLHMSERPSMPPGDRIAAMGKRAFRGGMVDYCWIVWDVQNPTLPGYTRTIWLPPLHEQTPEVEGLA